GEGAAVAGQDDPASAELAGGLDVEVAAGDAFREQAQTLLQGRKLDHGSTVSTMSPMASCTVGSSETACTTAISAARRGVMPRPMSSPVYTSSRVLTPSSKPCSRRLRTFSPMTASWSAN